MRILNVLLFNFVLSFGMSGCAPTVEERWETALQDLSKRASFDLDCPASELTFHELSDPSEQGVTGCDQRVTYIMVPYTGWVLNSVDHPATKPAPTVTAAPTQEEAAK